MRHLAVPALLSLLMPLVPPAMAGSGGTDNPRLDYRMDGYQDSHVTYDGHSHGYSGRWTGTWTGVDGKRYEGSWEGRFEGQAGASIPPAAHDYPPVRSDRRAAPDPAHYGSGQIIDGWYYPPAVVTRTVIEYRWAR